MMKRILTVTFLLTTLLTAAQQDLFLSGENYFQQGQYIRAFESYQAASVGFQQQQTLDQYALCNLKMAECHLETGALNQCMSQARNTLEYITDVLPQEKVLQLRAQLLLGEAYLKAGRNDLAMETLTGAEQSLPDPTDLSAAECYNDLGVVYWNNKNKETAKSYHERALKIRKARLKGEDPLLADSYLNLGLIYLEDDFLQAVINFNNALKIYQAAYGKNHPSVALCYGNLAFANSAQNNFGEALTYLDLTMNIWDSHYSGDHPNKAFTLSNRGRILEAQGDYHKALLTQQEALQQYIRLYGVKHPEVANTFYLIGSVQLKQENYKEAVESFQKSIYANLQNQEYTSLYDLPELQDYFNADILLSSLQYKAQALEALHFGKTLKPSDIKSALSTYLKCDDLISQIRQKRLTEGDKIRIGSIAADVYDDGIRTALYLSDKTFQKKYFREIAFTFCERSKSAVLLEAINETKAKAFAGIPNHLLALEDSLKTEISLLEQLLANTKDESRLGSLQNALFETRQSYRTFITRLEKEYPNYFNLKYRQADISVAALQEKLTPTAGVLSYFIGEESIFVFLISQKDFEVFSLPKADNLVQLTKGLRNAIKYHIPSTFQSSSVSLYKQLIPDLPDGLQSLTIIPDGLLGTIPFESLLSESKDGGNNTYLLEKYAISYDYAASLLLEKLDAPAGTARGILLTAPVTFEQNELTMASLPGSEQEVKEIRYLFLSGADAPEILLNDEASEAMLKSSKLSGYKYLHFATHGIVNESKPALSRIFLSPTENEDGSLYSGEIYGLNIGADLVTLSACETGLGKVEKGEGIIGLSRSLMYAGAKNLIVSLWQVSDASTAQLMIEFYKQHLNHSGNMIFADDLRKAKLSLLRSSSYSDPYYWAPFILIGL